MNRKFNFDCAMNIVVKSLIVGMGALAISALSVILFMQILLLPGVSGNFAMVLVLCFTYVAWLVGGFVYTLFTGFLETLDERECQNRQAEQLKAIENFKRTGL